MDWKKLSIVGKKPLFIPFSIVLLLTPLVSKLMYQIEVEYFVNPLDENRISLPINILLLYWSSFFMFLGQFLFSVFCPDIISHYKTYSDWKENCPVASNLFNERLLEKGDEKIQQIEIGLKEKYHLLVTKECLLLTPIRWLITFLYASGLLLAIILLSVQVHFVFLLT